MHRHACRIDNREFESLLTEQRGRGSGQCPRVADSAQDAGVQLPRPATCSEDGRLVRAPNAARKMLDVDWRGTASPQGYLKRASQRRHRQDDRRVRQGRQAECPSCDEHAAGFSLRIEPAEIKGNFVSGQTLGQFDVTLRAG